MGPSSAGHYVKMVHNGCEYGMMQLIAESYDILRTGLGLDAPRLAEIYSRWNEGELNSYLIEITAKVFAHVDPETGRPLVDLILDQAGQKGTGKWTSQNAADLGVPIPNIDAALWGRNISAFKSERVEASKILKGQLGASGPRDPSLVEDVRDALYAGMILSYAQAMAMLRGASREFGYGLNLSEIARIWKGGCIIRSKLLNPIQAAFASLSAPISIVRRNEPRVRGVYEAPVFLLRPDLHIAWRGDGPPPDPERLARMGTGQE